MVQRFLVFGDNHGDSESVRRVLADTEGERFDFAVHVGDFTDRRHDGPEAAAEQLRDLEPLLSAVADRTRHGLLWTYGDRDHYGDFPADLGVGVEVPDDGTVTVGGQRFTGSLDAVESDVVLVTHEEHWSRLDSFEGRAHLHGHTHRGRHLDRRLNAAFLQYTDRETGDPVYGGYFVVEVGDDGPLDVEMRSIGRLQAVTCERHGERGTQFQAFPECMYCRDSGILLREMAATAFYSLTGADEHETGADADGAATVTDDELVDEAVGLWTDPPDGFGEEFRSYLAGIGDDRYAPLARTGAGSLTVAEDSYAY